jgi:2-methylcitrate dehydratase PrpD
MSHDDREAGGTTRQLTEFVLKTDLASLRPATVHAAKRLILDTLGCTIGALSTEPGRVVSEFKRDQGGRPEATLVGSPSKVPASSAAYAHAQMANVLDADETFNWTHSACATVMPTIAVAESVGATGADLIAAVATAFEVGTRIAFSMPVYKVDEAGHLGRRGAVGFSWAAYGAAAGAGKLLGLDAEQLARAFGIAHVSMPAHGVATAFKGSSQPWHKYAMYAAIAEAGVNAALLARRGFVADARIFDEGTEFYRSMNAESSDRRTILAGLGEDWAVEQTALKPWPFCRYSHGTLDAFASLVAERDLKPDEVEGITVTVPPYNFIAMIASSVEVTEKLKIMTSLPYALAMIAYRVPAGPKWWSDEVFGNPAVHDFARRVRAEVDDSLNGEFLADLKAGRQLSSSKTPGLLAVSARGDVYKTAVGRALGDPTDPAKVWSDDALRAKVIEYSHGVLAQGAGAAIASAGFALETASDLNALMGPCVERA